MPQGEGALSDRSAYDGERGLERAMQDRERRFEAGT
jgi:hypothetical protein